MKVGQQLDNARRDMFAAAAFETNEDGTLSSRVDATKIREAIVAAVTKGDFALRTFSSGSVGTRLALKVSVSNEAGEEFDLSGSVLLTIPETVVKTK